MKKTVLLSVLSFGLALAACYKIDYTRQVSPAYAPSYDEWHHIGIFALVEFSEPVHLDFICPTGFAKVHHEISVINWLVTVALGTCGMSWAYTPSTVTVWCQSGLGYELDMTSDGMVAAAKRIE